MSKKQSETKRALWQNPEVRERMLAGRGDRRPFQHGNRYTYRRDVITVDNTGWPVIGTAAWSMDKNGNILCDEARRHQIWLDRISDL